MGTRPERGESVNAMTNMGEHVLMVNFYISLHISLHIF